MKPTELMIGDWVYYLHSAPTEWEPRQYRVVSYERGFISVADPEKCCKPIPLTEEIIKKNWFVFVTHDYEKIYKLSTSYSVSYKYDWSHGSLYLSIDDNNNILLLNDYGYCGKGDISSKTICKIKYVHELQHALRLCGLNELADNFNV